MDYLVCDGDGCTGLAVTREWVSALLGESALEGASDRSKLNGLVLSEFKVTDDTSDNFTKTCR